LGFVETENVILIERIDNIISFLRTTENSEFFTFVGPSPAPPAPGQRGQREQRANGQRE
jgi:hypothetical protein